MIRIIARSTAPPAMKSRTLGFGFTSGVFDAASGWPSVGADDADIIRVNSPGPDVAAFGPFPLARGAAGFPTEKTPVAEFVGLETGWRPPNEKSDGGGFPADFAGLPNI